MSTKRKPLKGIGRTDTHGLQSLFLASQRSFGRLQFLAASAARCGSCALLEARDPRRSRERVEA